MAAVKRPPDLEISHVDAEVEEMQGKIRLLEEEMRSFERDMEYERADAVKQKVDDLKKRITNNRLNELSKFQNMQVGQMDYWSQSQREEFDKLWNAKTEGHNEQTNALLKELKAKHNEQKRVLEEYLAQPKPVRYSAGVVEMLNILRALGKQKRYAEAAEYKKNVVDRKKNREDSEWAAKLAHNAKVMTSRLREKQITERNGLEARCARDYSELLKSMNEDRGRLEMRLRNADHDLKRQQAVEFRMSEKPFICLPKLAATSTRSNIRLTVSSAPCPDQRITASTTQLSSLMTSVSAPDLHRKPHDLSQQFGGLDGCIVYDVFDGPEQMLPYSSVMSQVYGGRC
mmetsp:Transcript_41571/g.69292  ORF Transcript_41571/g.69292 Transcript_41571/m.69292 type:complete len:343 (-) Transcript_41571:185-1213(-)